MKHIIFIIGLFILVLSYSYSTDAAWGSKQGQSNQTTNTSNTPTAPKSAEDLLDTPYMQDFIEFAEKVNKAVQEDLKDAFDNVNTQAQNYGDFKPAVDTENKGDRYSVNVDIPGMQKQDIDIEIKEGVLTVSGYRQINRVATADDDSFSRHERRFGAFERVVELPEDANEDDIAASYEAGVLNVSIGKKAIEVVAPKKVTIS